MSIVDVDGVTYEEEYRAPCIGGSSVPMLWGIQSLEQNRALIDCKTGELYLMGPGGYEIKTSPGFRKFKMKKGRSGHRMLPVSKFNDKHKTTDSGAFNTGTVNTSASQPSTTPTTSSTTTSTSSSLRSAMRSPAHPPRVLKPGSSWIREQ